MKYYYTAKSFQGETRSGTLEAKNEKELAQILRQEGLILITATLKEPKKKLAISSLIGQLPFLARVSLKEKIFFTRNLRVMIASGLPLPRALKILSEQSRNKKFKRVLERINEEVIRGKSFSEALSFHPNIFPELFQNVIKVGEEGGTLEEVLKTLTSQMEREQELRSKIKGALIYPSVIIFAMLGIGILMLVMVVPKLAETFQTLKIELPTTTKLVIFLGNFFVKKWYWLIFLIIVFLIILRISLRTKIGKKIIDKLILIFPVVAPLVRKINAAYTVRTLSNLITSGVPIVRSLEIISGALGNVYFKKAMKVAAEKVEKGEKLSEALKPYQDIYPPLVIQMMAVGEETGETSAILSQLADFFEEEVTNATKNLSSIIEPILMLLIGGVVGFFAISMVQPMYSMLQAIK